jgi:transcription elongation factor Elf1
LRESSKLDKTKLPVDVYEGWLKGQRTQPVRTHSNKNTVDYYEAWITERVKVKEQKNSTKDKRPA